GEGPLATSDVVADVETDPREECLQRVRLPKKAHISQESKLIMADPTPGGDQDRDARETNVLLHAGKEFPPCHDRHLQVEDDQGGVTSSLGCQKLKGDLAVLGFEHEVSLSADQLADQIPRIRLVVHHEDVTQLLHRAA